MNTNIIVSISKYVEKIINHVEGYTLDKAHKIFRTHNSEVDQEYKRQTTISNLLDKVKLELERGDFSKAIVYLICVNTLNKTKLNQVKIALKEDLTQPKKVVQPTITKPVVTKSKPKYDVKALEDAYMSSLELLEFRWDVEAHQLDVLENSLQLSLNRLYYELDSLGQQLGNTVLNRSNIMNIQLKMQQNYKFAMGIADILSKGVK